MGLLNALDKLANAGARSRMPADTLTHAKDQSVTTNLRNHLAIVAANPGAARVARKAARDQLVAAVGATEADKLIKQADRKVKDSFR